MGIGSLTARVWFLKIDQRYARVIHFQKVLEKEKYAILTSLQYLYEAQMGDAESFDRLIESNSIRIKKLIPENTPTEFTINCSMTIF